MRYSSFYGGIATTAHFNWQDINFLTNGIFNDVGRTNQAMMILRFGFTSMLGIILILILQKHLPQQLRRLFYIYLPYFLFWMLAFSYDDRNLIFLWPVLGLCLGFALSRAPALQNLQQELKRIASFRLPIFACILAGLLISVLVVQPKILTLSGLIQQQVTQKNETLPAKDFALLRYITGQADFKGMILSPNPYFQYIPFLKGKIFPIPLDAYAANMLPDFFQKQSTLTALLKANPNIQYLLLQAPQKEIVESPAVQHLLNQWQEQNKLSLIVADPFMQIYRFN